MMAILNWRVWSVVAMGIALAVSHWKVYVMGINKDHAEWMAERFDQAEQSASIAAEAAKKTTDLQTSADSLRKAKNATIAKLNADLAVALDGLRDRPARPGAGDLPESARTGSATGCTGASLFAEDASALIREAGRADKLRIDLAQCQAAYEYARAALN